MQGASPLAVAAQEGHIPVLQLLLQHEADPLQQDHHGRDPYRVALRYVETFPLFLFFPFSNIPVSILYTIPTLYCTYILVVIMDPRTYGTVPVNVNLGSGIIMRFKTTLCRRLHHYLPVLFTLILSM